MEAQLQLHVRRVQRRFGDSNFDAHYHVSCLYLPSFSIASKNASADF